MSRPFAIPLAPHGPAGALDVGLAACGAAPALWLRLAAAGAAPVAILADAAGRAFGAGWVTGATAVAFVTVPLGLRIATLAARGTFDEDLPARPPTRTRRQRTAEALLSALCVLSAALYLAPRWLDLPTAFGAWLAGPVVNFWVGVGLAAAAGGRASLDLSRRAPLPPGGRRLLWSRTWRRLVVLWPLALFWLPGAEPAGWTLAVLWAPFGLTLAGRWAFHSERAALRGLSARLHDDHADALLRSATVPLGGRAVALATLCGGVWLVVSLTGDLIGSALLATRPLLGAALEGSSFWRAWLALHEDATAAAFASAVAIAVYVAGRVGWFATLVDLRVRTDCWDVQQAVTRERNRLAEEERRLSPATGASKTPGAKRPAKRHRARTAGSVAALLLVLCAPIGHAASVPPRAQRAAAGGTSRTVAGLRPAVHAGSVHYGALQGADPAEIADRADAVLNRNEFRHLRDFGADGDGLFPPLDRVRPTVESDPFEETGASGPGAPGASGSPGGGGNAGGGGSSPGGVPGAGTAAAGAGVLGLILSTVAVWVAGIVLVGVLALLLWAVARGLLDRERTPKSQLATVGATHLDDLPGRAAMPAADERLAAARESAAAGRYAEAVGTLLAGLTDRVETAGLIRPRRGLTAREYLRAARPHPALHPALRTLVKMYEPLGYGRRPGRLEQYAEAEAAYLAGVSEKPSAATATPGAT